MSQGGRRNFSKAGGVWRSKQGSTEVVNSRILAVEHDESTFCLFFSAGLTIQNSTCSPFRIDSYQGVYYEWLAMRGSSSQPLTLRPRVVYSRLRLAYNFNLSPNSETSSLCIFFSFSSVNSKYSIINPRSRVRHPPKLRQGIPLLPSQFPTPVLFSSLMQFSR